MGINGLGVYPIIKDAFADLVELLVVVIFVEGVLLKRGVLVLDGPFVAVHTLCFKLIKNTIRVSNGAYRWAEKAGCRAIGECSYG